ARCAHGRREPPARRRLKQTLSSVLPSPKTPAHPTLGFFVLSGVLHATARELPYNRKGVAVRGRPSPTRSAVAHHPLRRGPSATKRTGSVQGGVRHECHLLSS